MVTKFWRTYVRLDGFLYFLSLQYEIVLLMKIVWYRSGTCDLIVAKLYHMSLMLQGHVHRMRAEPFIKINAYCGLFHSTKCPLCSKRASWNADFTFIKKHLVLSDILSKFRMSLLKEIKWFPFEVCIIEQFHLKISFMCDYLSLGCF